MAARLKPHTVAPITPTRAAGRPFTVSTPLGKILEHKRISVQQLSLAVQQAFGPNHGCNPQRISRYLNEKEPIPPDHRMKLATVLKVKEDWL